MSDFVALRHEVRDLRRQLAEASTDAVRYRLLAKDGWIDDAIMARFGIKEGDKKSLDAAIDRILSTEDTG